MKKQYIRYILEVVFFLVLVAIDLGTKTLVFDLLKDENYYVVLDKIFALRLARNTGASFSILSGQLTFLTIMPLIAIAAIFTLLIVRPNTPTNLRVSIIMIAAGALGNVIDRLALGYVRDFIDYVFLDTFFGIDFAIGNVADLFLLMGVVLLVVYIIFEFSDSDFYSKKKLARIQAEQQKVAVAQIVEDQDGKQTSRFLIRGTIQ